MTWGEGEFKAIQGRTLDGPMVNVDSVSLLKVRETAPGALLWKSAGSRTYVSGCLGGDRR